MIFEQGVYMKQENLMMIARLGLAHDHLHGETVIVTGAGGGVGFEAARALLWLGANVVIAEINTPNGSKAAGALGAEFNTASVLFVPTDVGDEASVINLYNEAVSHFGKVDVVINNATIAALGKVIDLPIEEWDASYRVNLRGPVLMAKTFLPDMINRKHGIFVCVSSSGTAFMGSYETFKAAQVHLSNTLDAELEGTGVIAFTIGPGLVPTETAMKAVGQLAPQMGMTVEEFFALNKSIVISSEEAGAGFAASIVFAEKFRGQEISSIQALKAADINFGAGETENKSVALNAQEREQMRTWCERVRVTLMEQSDGWKHRSLFERQWVIRDFKKTAGMPAEEWLGMLAQLEENLHTDEPISRPPLEKLASYYNHLAELAKGYEKDPVKLEENLRQVYGWRDEVEQLEKLIR
jgi:NAD(P)-dependent dehydrogenase (short-subunit alcohol dehydrogenase family)